MPYLKTARLEIPTYDPNGPKEWDHQKTAELTLQAAEGLRVVMGDPADEQAPDVHFERAIVREEGKPPVEIWRLFIHPDRGDPLCFVEFRRGERVTITTDTGKLIHEQLLT